MKIFIYLPVAIVVFIIIVTSHYLLGCGSSSVRNSLNLYLCIPVHLFSKKKRKNDRPTQMLTLKGQVNYFLLLASWGYSADVYLEQGFSTSFALRPRRAKHKSKSYIYVFKRNTPLVLLYLPCILRVYQGPTTNT